MAFQATEDAAEKRQNPAVQKKFLIQIVDTECGKTETSQGKG
jgi:hypothetical protein